MLTTIPCRIAELEVPELYQLKKEVWDEPEDELDGDGTSQSSESLLRDDFSAASERSLTYGELKNIPVDDEYEKVQKGPKKRK